MPESSVDSYIAAQPEQAMSKDEYWQLYKAENYSGSVHPAAHYNDFNYKVAKFFGSGPENRFEDAYESYLRNLNNVNEFRATQSAREYEKMMDDTKYQRMMKDFEAAGLNPYLLINNGGISASSVPSGAKSSYKYDQQSHKETDKGRNAALIVLALARLAAALL